MVLSFFYWIGKSRENKHIQSLNEREARTAMIQVSNLKKLKSLGEFKESELFSGSVVIAFDYFKVFALAIKGIFGGRIESSAILIERARREAICRLKEEALSWDAKMIANLRLETSSIGGNQGGDRSLFSVEVIAYGTALK